MEGDIERQQAARAYMAFIQQPEEKALPIVPVFGGQPVNAWQAAVNAPETRQTVVNENHEPTGDPLRAMRAQAEELQAGIRARANQPPVPELTAAEAEAKRVVFERNAKA